MFWILHSPETLSQTLLGSAIGAGSETAILAFTFLGFLQGLMQLVLVVVCVSLIAVILIQDPKGGGLTSAFGAGPGGDSILGARAQKDVNRFTTILTVALLSLVLSIVLLDNYRKGAESAGSKLGNSSTQAEKTDTEEGGSLSPLPAEEGDGTVPPVSPAPGSEKTPPPPASGGSQPEGKEKGS